MRLISNRNLKIIKLFLVSVILEKLLLVSFIVTSIGLFVTQFFVLLDPEISNRYVLISTRLQNTFTAVNSTAAFITWIEDEFISIWVNSTISSVKLVGSMRLSQYRISIPEDCIGVSINNASIAFATSFYCNPIMTSGTNQEPIQPPNDTSLCLKPSCIEFNISNGWHIADSNTVQYPKSAFDVYMSLENTSITLETIQINGWLDPLKTKALVLESLFIDLHTHCLFTFRFTFENIGYFLTDTRIYRNHIVNYAYSTFVVITLWAILIADASLSACKALFEIGFSFKPSHISDMICAGLQLAYIGIVGWKLNRLSTLFPDINSLYIFGNSFDYYQIYSLNTIDDAEDILIGFLVLFIPFKFFSLISWIKVAKVFNTFCSALYRTFITLLIYGVMMLLLMISWGSIYYYLLRNYDTNFESILGSIFYFVLLNTILVPSSDDYFKLSAYHNDIKYVFCYIMLYVTRVVFWTFFIAFLAEAYRRASNFEYYQMTSSEIIRKNFITDLSKKIDKFKKEYLPHGEEQEDASLKNKMLVWFDVGIEGSESFQRISTHISDNSINLMPFKTPTEMVQFIKYLFQLKPMLIQKSTSQFRIIYEIKESKLLDKYGRDKFLKNISKAQYLLMWLKSIGGKVPILISSKTKLDYESRLNLRKTYGNLFFTNSEEELVSFALFLPLDAIKFSNIQENNVPTNQSLDSLGSQIYNIEDEIDLM